MPVTLFSLVSRLEDPPRWCMQMTEDLSKNFRCSEMAIRITNSILPLPFTDRKADAHIINYRELV